jgi:hypothetical protein
MTNPTPNPACGLFEERMNRALDGECSLADLAYEPHLAACADCRASLSAVQLMLNGLDAQPTILPPVGFVDRVVPVVLAERKQTQERAWTLKMFLGSLAASIALAIGVAAPWRTAPDTSVAKAVPPKVVPSVQKSFADAGSAVVSLTKKAATETLAPAKNLFAFAESKKPTAPARATEVPAATTAIQPITDTTKRAINLFIRDVGSLASIQNKMKS